MWRQRTVGAAVVVALAGLGGCRAEPTLPTLTWYTNPDPAQADEAGNRLGQRRLAALCSTDRYTVEVEVLPTSATEQRIQLMRRLAARDASIDLMSLDPVFTAELAAARFLAPIPQVRRAALSEGVLEGALRGAVWEDQLAVVPLWANTQVLWYRRSAAREADLDLTQPVTWDELIAAAERADRTVQVQGNKYEGFVVWLNALISGAGGALVTDTQRGKDATIAIDSQAGRRAAEIVARLAASSAADPQLSVSHEGTALDGMAKADGAFQVNWTFVYRHDYPAEVEADLGWARYPRTLADQPSRPPIGGINIGIGAYTRHPELALEAATCITSEENQVRYALDTGNMPARAAAYDHPELTARYPAELLGLFRESIEQGGPRPASPYWSTIVSAILHEWHPPREVDPHTTPRRAAELIRSVLDGDALL